MFEDLRFPVLVAPMAGGPTTPELVAAVVEAGGSGFLAAGYLRAGALADRIAKTRELTGGTFGVNLFVPGSESTVDLGDYVRRIETEAARYGAEPGEPRWDDDDYPAKLNVVVEERIPFVSFTFGLPSPQDVARLHESGSQVIVTVTSPAEAVRAVEVGADALCVQGFEAGAHRGLFTDDPADPAGGGTYGLLALLRLVSAEVDLPLIATGGLVHGADVAAVLTAGAVAAQLGTAFLRADEAGTQSCESAEPIVRGRSHPTESGPRLRTVRPDSQARRTATQGKEDQPAYRQALAEGSRDTAFTRAFSGRTARGLVNRFQSEHSAVAPAAYPQVHYLTRPVRAAAGKVGDPEGINLWGGQTYPLATDGPAAEIFERVRGEALAAVRRMKLD